MKKKFEFWKIGLLVAVISIFGIRVLQRTYIYDYNHLFVGSEKNKNKEDYIFKMRLKKIFYHYESVVKRPLLIKERKRILKLYRRYRIDVADSLGISLEQMASLEYKKEKNKSADLSTH